jgi:hypothetical protein
MGDSDVIQCCAKIGVLGWRIEQCLGASRAPIRLNADKGEGCTDTVRQPRTSVIALSMVPITDKPILLLLQVLAMEVRLTHF